MTPESIVVSLEWAKKLGEAGWPQTACWFWTEYTDNGKEADPFLYGSRRGGECPLLTPPNTHRFYAAPTAEEILRRLPHTLLLKHRRAAGFAITKNTMGYSVRYFAPIAPLDNEDRKEDGRAKKAEAFGYDKSETEDTLANAAAAMYCYLVQHELLPLT